VLNYGYDEGRLLQGKKLYEELMQVSFEQEKARHAKHEVFTAKQTLQLSIHKLYMKYLKIARIVFADDLSAREALLLDGSRERTYVEWVFQVSAFCSNMLNNPDFLVAMAAYGISKKEISDLQKQLVEINIISDKGLKCVGELRRLTSLKKKKVLVMQNYVSDFLKIARIALEDNPQLLECLGVVVKS